MADDQLAALASAEEREFRLARAKFPMEFQPLVKLLAQRPAQAHQTLAHMDRYMHQLTRDFRQYEVSDEDTTVIVLLDNMCVYKERPEDKGGALIIPAGTKGKIIPNNTSVFLVLWQFDYNGWTYLSRVLDYASKVAPIDPVVEDILRLLAAALQDASKETANEILQDMAAGLMDGDIIGVVERVIEEALVAKHLALSLIGLDFMSALVSIQPTRVYRFLDSSSLLEGNGHNGMASFILSSVEVINGEYSFTVALVKLAEMLIRDAVVSAVAENFDRATKADVLLRLTSHLCNVYESYPFWKYQDVAQRDEIAWNVATIFTSILSLVYRIDGQAEGTAKIHGALFRAADRVVDQLLVPDGSSSRALHVLVQTLEALIGNLNPASAVYGHIHDSYQWMNSTLELAETLIKVRTLAKLPPSQLERQIFFLAPELAALYAADDLVRFRIMRLFRDLVSAPWGDEPPSLLAHLRSSVAATFVGSIASAVQDTADDDAVIETMNFLTAVFTHRQQGFSILLMSGKELGLPDKDSKCSDTTVVSVLEKQFLDFDKRPLAVQTRLLESIATAQTTWATAIFDNAVGERFWANVFAALERGVVAIEGTERTDQTVRVCENLVVAARAAQVCSVRLHRDRKPTKETDAILDHLLTGDTLVRLGSACLQVQGYRAELHSTLERTFDQNWPRAALKRFSWTHLVDRKYGESFMYDLETMDEVLASDVAWPRFRDSVVAANLNMSLTDAQTILVRTWLLFIAALVEYSDREPRLLRPLEKIATTCLHNNLSEGLRSSIFTKIFVERAEHSFLIVHRLYLAAYPGRAKVLEPVSVLASPTPTQSAAKAVQATYDFKALFFATTAIINSVDVDFPKALTERNHTLYRPLLRILVLCARALKGGPRDTALARAVGGIFENVVSKAFMVLGTGPLEALALLDDGGSVAGGDRKENQDEPARPARLGESDDDGVCDMLLVVSLLRDCLAIEGAV
ncbi:nucleoporin subcomplex protein binding to Pom34-domain-containing protein [Dipodascopsis tothii]|uniref:nucleoporin subcomplex protein binding to Pom34-domain-containing protein n=1 Tax=Dipodascopsis tothii TaxID=44089 RepID=UPI0034CE0BFA